MARLRIGELLVEAKLITQDQLDEALAAQRSSGRKLGQVLTEQRVVTETQLTQVLGKQLSVPWVSLYHVEFARHLLNLVPREVAEQYCLVPIFVRRVRKQGETLYVAMDDPTQEAALEAVAKSSSLAVKPMIACPSDIRSAIRVYYGNGDVAPKETPPAASPDPGKATLPAGTRIQKPPPPKPKGKPDPAAPEISSKADAEAGDSPDAWPVVEATTFVPKRKGAPKMVALTLLDGTTIQIPAKPSRKSDAPPSFVAPEHFTAGDLINALRAVCQGADASEILGQKVQLEALFAALLSLLLKKGVIADWEFIEELRKI